MEKSKKTSKEEDRPNPWVDNSIRGMEMLIVIPPETLQQQSRLPAGWKEVELGDIFIFKEKTGIQAGEGLDKGKYKFFTSSDRQSKFLDRFNFKDEHLIFSTGGKAGIHYCDESFSVSNDCFVTRINKHSTKFIYYFLKSKMYLLERGFKGAGLKHLSKDYLKKLKIPLPFSNGTPNLKEQERIVSILEKAETLKKKGKNAEDLLDIYLKSIFWEMFLEDIKKWEIVKLGDIFEIVRGGSPRPIQEYITTEKNGINWIKIGDTKGDSKYIYKTGEKIKPEGLKKSRLVKIGDFILSNSMSFGRPYILRTEGCIHDGWLLIRDINKKTNENYFYSILISDYVYSQFISSASGSTVKNLNIDLVKKVKIPLPPLPLQQKFASIVEQVEKMKENVKKTKQSSEELFNSLMQKAFRGEL